MDWLLLHFLVECPRLLREDSDFDRLTDDTRIVPLCFIKKPRLGQNVPGRCGDQRHTLFAGFCNSRHPAPLTRTCECLRRSTRVPSGKDDDPQDVLSRACALIVTGSRSRTSATGRWAIGRSRFSPSRQGNHKRVRASAPRTAGRAGNEDRERRHGFPSESCDCSFTIVVPAECARGTSTTR